MSTRECAENRMSQTPSPDFSPPLKDNGLGTRLAESYSGNKCDEIGKIYIKVNFDPSFETA